MYAVLEERQHQETAHALAAAHNGGRSIAEQISLVRQLDIEGAHFGLASPRLS